MIITLPPQRLRASASVAARRRAHSAARSRQFGAQALLLFCVCVWQRRCGWLQTRRYAAPMRICCWIPGR